MCAICNKPELFTNLTIFYTKYKPVNKTEDLLFQKEGNIIFYIINKDDALLL